MRQTLPSPHMLRDRHVHTVMASFDQPGGRRICPLQWLMAGHSGSWPVCVCCKDPEGGVCPPMPREPCRRRAEVPPNELKIGLSDDDCHSHRATRLSQAEPAMSAKPSSLRCYSSGLKSSRWEVCSAESAARQNIGPSICLPYGFDRVTLALLVHSRNWYKTLSTIFHGDG